MNQMQEENAGKRTLEPRHGEGKKTKRSDCDHGECWDVFTPEAGRTERDAWDPELRPSVSWNFFPFMERNHRSSVPVMSFGEWQQAINQDPMKWPLCCIKTHLHYPMNLWVQKVVPSFPCLDLMRSNPFSRRGWWVADLECPVRQSTESWTEVDGGLQPTKCVEFYQPRINCSDGWADRTCLHFPNCIFMPPFTEAHWRVYNLDDLQKHFDDYDREPALKKLSPLLFAEGSAKMENRCPLVTEMLRCTPVLFLWVLLSDPEGFRESRKTKASYLSDISGQTRSYKRMMRAEGAFELLELHSQVEYLKLIFTACSGFRCESSIGLWFETLIQAGLLDSDLMGAVVINDYEPNEPDTTWASFQGLGWGFHNFLMTEQNAYSLSAIMTMMNVSGPVVYSVHK